MILKAEKLWVSESNWNPETRNTCSINGTWHATLGAAQTGSGKTLAFLIPVSKQTYWFKRNVEIHKSKYKWSLTLHFIYISNVGPSSERNIKCSVLRSQCWDADKVKSNVSSVGPSSERNIEWIKNRVNLYTYVREKKSRDRKSDAKNNNKMHNKMLK